MAEMTNGTSSFVSHGAAHIESASTKFLTLINALGWMVVATLHFRAEIEQLSGQRLLTCARVERDRAIAWCDYSCMR